MDNDPQHTSHSTRRFIILNNINHFKTKYFLIVGRGIMELKLFLMFFIEGRRGRKGAVKGPSGAIRGHTGAIRAIPGPSGPYRGHQGHTGAIGAIPGPSGAIWGRWPQVYFSPSRIVFICLPFSSLCYFFFFQLIL